MNTDSMAFRRRVSEEAGQWFATMQQGQVSQSEREEFARWLAQSARHVEEYLAMTSAWRLSAHASREIPSSHALIEAAREHLRKVTDHPSRVVPVQSGARRTRFALRPSFAAAAAVVAAALIAGWMLLKPDTLEYRTHDGDRLTASLADGSTVHLNNHTAIRVKLGPQFRDIELLEGEALFEAAKDPHRPFRVLSGSNVIRAIGTSFNVVRRQNLTTVTVIEGQVDVVALDASSAAPAPVRLAPRQQVKVESRGKVLARDTVDIDDAIAWTRPVLRFSDQPLAEVIARFNQYNRRQLKIDDAALGAVRISGVFSSADPDSFIEYLRRTENIQIEEGTTTRIVRGADAAAADSR